MFTEGVAEVCGGVGEDCGRYVVATRSLAKDTEVLFEKPFVFGPKQSSKPVCIECCSAEISQNFCQRCGLPLCQNCSPDNLVHHRAECEIFQENKLDFRGLDAGKVFPCITVLRLILAGQHDLQTHTQEREDTPVWVYNKKAVVPFITSLTVHGKHITEDEVHAATGALDTNTFHIQDAGVLGRAVFSTASNFNNSCTPNCYKMVSREGIQIKTSRPVEKGEELSICYTGLLTPNHIRKAVFEQTKHFSCRCSRCGDESECGSYPTALRCTDCGGNVRQTGSCAGCVETMEQDRIQQISLMADTVSGRLVKEEDCMILSSGLKKLGRMLSVHHFYLVKLKLHFIKHAGLCKEGCCTEQADSCRSELQDLYTLLGIPEQMQFNEIIREHQQALTSMQHIFKK